MKHFFTCLAFLCSTVPAVAANSLLQNPTTGAIPTQSALTSICMIANNTDAALAIGSGGAVYIIDIGDAAPADAAANTITSIPNFIASKLNALAGKTVTVIDMVVNPRSKSVYVLGKSTGSSGVSYHLFKVRNNGASVTLVNLSNVSYSKVNLTSGYKDNSMAWGDNKLYVSSSGSRLNAELAYAAPPFAHNSNFSKRLTSMFQSNSGSQYITTAPLEKMAYGVVGTKKRLAGLTTCAPGFSIDLAGLSGTGTLLVTEDFNVHQGMPDKVILLNHDGKSWLYELHDAYSGNGTVYRIGQKYLDGSQVTANKYNKNAEKLRTNSGARAAGLTDAEIKQMGRVAAMAQWDDSRVLVLDPAAAGGSLRLIRVAVVATGIGGIDGSPLQLHVYPNPASGELHVGLPEGVSRAAIAVYSMDGRLCLREEVAGPTATLRTANLQPGQYTMTLSTAAGAQGSTVFTVSHP